MSTLPNPIDEWLREVAAKLSADQPEGRDLAYNPAPELTVHKSFGFVTLSNDLLMDVGAIPDTRPPVHIPWRRRLRRRLNAWREQVGRKVGGWIAGVDLSDPDDW
jgi:hypothetical protein